MVKRKLPSKNNGRERGTALFVVVLAITMLTGIGLYTVHSAALLARASGNEREATQTAYLAQIGTLAALAQISSKAQAYVPQALSGTDDCRMNLGLDTTKFAAPPCLELSSVKYTLATGHGLFDSDSFAAINDPSTGAPAISGRFLTEVTDVAPVPNPQAGMDAVTRNAFRYYEAKLTTIAQLQPAAATAACVQNVMQVAGQHITRAHVIVGPVGGM